MSNYATVNANATTTGFWQYATGSTITTSSTFTINPGYYSISAGTETIKYVGGYASCYDSYYKCSKKERVPQRYKGDDK